MTLAQVQELRSGDKIGMLPHKGATSPYVGSVVAVGATLLTIKWLCSNTMDAIGKNSPIWYGVDLVQR